jgi:signal transduction histidine kinase
MGLRAKLTVGLLLLLVLPILAVSALEIDRTMTVMVGDLEQSGLFLINQTFEQIRDALSHSAAQPAAVLHHDERLRAFLDSSQALGKGVVYVRIEKLDGAVILDAGAGTQTGSAQANNAPFQALKDKVSAWWPPARIGALWGERTYEISRTVEINNQPFAVIRVGLSTALIAAEARHSVESILGIAAIAIALSLVGAAFFRALMLRPVLTITTGVEQMAEGRDEVRLQIGGRDELSTLAEKFNQLSQRIRTSRTQWETERGQFFNVLRSITDGVLLLDWNGVVLFANTEAQSRLGLPAGGLAEGKPLNQLIGQDNSLIRMTETAYTAGTEVRDVPVEFGEGANPNRFLVSVFSLGRGPEPPGLLVIVRDLEAVKQLESVVDYSGRLVRLGGLISGVAHQIRNPLNAMSLQLELLSNDAGQKKPVGRRIDALRGEVGRLDQAVSALMRFMRPEALKLTEVCLNDLLRETVAKVVRPGVQLQYRLDPALAPIRADRALLGEALSNIACNAVEAMPRGGTLTVGSANRPDGLVELSLADQGEGIAPENLDRIFQLYFTTKTGGSGLGLSLALRAIDLHGGTLDVQSEVGSGTTVSVRLPIANQPGIAATPVRGSN